YGTTQVAAKKLGVSYSLLRSIIRLLDLPDEVQNLVKEKRILYDAAQRLLTLHDPKQQIEVANAIVDLPSHKQREIIRYAKGHPKGELRSVIGRINKPKPQSEKIRVAVIPLREETYSSLFAFGAKRKISVEKLILNIIDDWKEGRRATA